MRTCRRFRSAAPPVRLVVGLFVALAAVPAAAAGRLELREGGLLVVEGGGLGTEDEGEDELGVGHDRGSPGNGDTDRDTTGQPEGPTGKRKSRPQGWPGAAGGRGREVRPANQS